MPEPIYLNHGGTSWPKPCVVQAAVEAAMQASPSEWPVMFEDAHLTLAAFFGIARPEELLLTPGCTSSLLTAINNADIRPGSRVLTSCWEHHAVYGPLRKLATRDIRITVIPPDRDTVFDLNVLEKELRVGDVGLVTLTAACNVTGDLLPIEEITEIAHQHGAMVLIDAAQVVGWIDLDFQALQADMVAFGGHKGLQAPWGIGGLYTSETASMQCIDSACELPPRGSTKTRTSYDAAFSARPEYCDVGSVDQFSLAGLKAAVEWLSDEDSACLLRQAREQTLRLRSALESFKNVKIYGAANSDVRLPTLAFAVHDQSSSQVAGILRQNGLIVGSGLQCSPLSHESLGTIDDGLIRLSVGIRQSDEEIDQALTRLANALDRLNESD